MNPPKNYLKTSLSARATWDRVTPARLVVAETAKPTVHLRVEGGQEATTTWENEITLSPSKPTAILFLSNLSDDQSEFIFQENSSFDLSELSFCLNPGEEKQLKVEAKNSICEFGSNTINFVENGTFNYQIKVDFINDQEGFNCEFDRNFDSLPAYFRLL